VTFDGRYEKVVAAGLAPRPVQRPIPIWFGGTHPAALRRAGQLADGWFPQVPPGPRLDESLEHVRAAATEAGRDPATIGIEGSIRVQRGLEVAVDHAQRWRTAGATHLSVNTMGISPGTPVGIDRHIAALAELANAIGLPPRPTS
jgi:alkanesulfonate monooxygenase SsuD/methylene tetrahydromethanopterin reductase-like flavin-dependent oxidoreductase (luciferase family)